MAFYENCIERAAALAGGIVWAASATDAGLEPLVMATVGAAGLGAVIRDAVARRGPEDPKRLARIQARIRQDFEAWQRSEGLEDAALAAADAALTELLGRCFLDRAELARSAVTADGFPEAATELVLARLARENPLFEHPPAGVPRAREFASVVVRTALREEVADRDYFARLEPQLMFEIAQGIGRVDTRLADLQRQVEALTALRAAPGRWTRRSERGQLRSECRRPGSVRGSCATSAPSC